MEGGASFRRVNVKPHYCRINFENVNSKVSNGSKIQFLLVEKENKFGWLHKINLKSRMASVHIGVFHFY